MAMSMRMVVCLSTALAVLASAVVAPDPALAGVGVQLGGMFSITPARRYIVARPPVALSATRVANTTQSTMRVRVSSVLLTQLPSGAFTFDPSPEGLLDARRVLDTAPKSFYLPPGASREVSLRWRRLPPGARTANAGVIYEAVPRLGHTPVRIVERLLGVDILRLPGRYRFSGQLVGVHVTQTEPGVLRFSIDARNTGQAVAGPSRLVLTIHDQLGARLLRKQLTSDIVLPGATREFTLDVKHRLPAGSYTAIAHMSFGSSHRLTVRTFFHLVGPNKLPSSQLHLGPLIAQGTVGKGVQVTATLKNTGTAAGAIRVTLGLYRLTNGIPSRQPIATRQLTTDSLAPGHGSQLQDGFGGRLARGTYRLVAAYNADGTPQTIVADFQAQQPLGPLAQLRRFSREHPLLIPCLLILLSGIIALMFIREHRLRHTLEAAR
jgi:hypothetical protein